MIEYTVTVDADSSRISVLQDPPFIVTVDSVDNVLKLLHDNGGYCLFDKAGIMVYKITNDCLLKFHEYTSNGKAQQQ